MSFLLTTIPTILHPLSYTLYNAPMRFLLSAVIFFSAGFLIRDYTGPVKLPVSIRTVKEAVKPEKTADNVPGNIRITYENGKFSPSEAVIALGRYLYITNNSDSLMWLESNNPLLSTPRGYAFAEELRVRMDEAGTYQVKNKLNTGAKTVIRVVQ